ncbi:zeta toxin family protein [Neopusillimonas aromaticivorans]|uniref:zeta toxin family protein n=1 Tax=Neopusillimonas aromaticivorans TaxID=2979868 RepID=UPI00259A86A4|nr:zeta toxin family protein [Neopusillimonas aromaticivorans]WJJ94236.1 zeta toxin family protein [Neopusillimonas aromaticivorans]
MPRLRMFAGPNGSGKSTMKEVIPQELLGVYVNPDEIEKAWRQSGCIDLSMFKVRVDAEEVLAFFMKSTFLANAGFSIAVSQLRFDDNRLCLDPELVNSYFASVVSDFIRHKLLEQKIDFTFETVMSSADKVDFLHLAKAAGFRVYLYYVATEDPEINISRVQYRVKMHGHDVPEDKIVERYFRSLDLLVNAIRLSDRAYIFDNSSQDRIWLAEVTDGAELEFKTDLVPHWFEEYVLDRLS